MNVFCLVSGALPFVAEGISNFHFAIPERIGTVDEASNFLKLKFL